MAAAEAGNRAQARRLGPSVGELPFVGRDTPLAALVSAVQAAEAGERVVALVAGEPGIGKTRLVQELATRVASRVLWATGWDGAGAPAFWPWLQLLRELRAPGAAASVLEPDIVRRVDVLMGRGPALDQSAEARFAMFDAVAELFARASQSDPLVLVLEDLQWADEGSVRLLEFLGRDRRRRRMAIVGTYRDSGMDREHPVARRLAELVGGGLHLSLHGLGQRDIEGLLAAMGGDDASAGEAFVALLHRRSGGNPFFLRELLRMRAEGSLDSSRPGVAAEVLPAGIHAVVARRVSGLTAPARDLLAVAAVASPDLEISLLAAVTERSEGELMAALDEAQSAGLLAREGMTGTFGFVHALVRDVLYDELPLESRTALHGRLAAAIEQRYGEERLPQLAHHFVQSSVSEADERAIEYSLRAAEQSFGLLAYEEAAAWYGRAREMLRLSRASGHREDDLLLRQGDALVAAGDLPAAREAFRHAALIARRCADAEQLARAALGLGTGLPGFEVQPQDPVQIELLEEAVAAIGPGPSRLRARLLARLSVALSFIDTEERRLALSNEAVAIARELGDDAVLGYALAGRCDAIAGPDHCEPRLADATEVVRLARAAGDRPLEMLGRRLRLVALLETGDIEEADSEIERFARLAEAVRQPLYRWYVPLWRGMRALMRGELDEAARQCAAAEDIGATASSANAALLTFTQWWVRKRYEGHFAEAGTAMADLLERASTGTVVNSGQRAIAALQTGDTEKAAAILEHVRAGLPGRARDSEWLAESAQLAQAAVAIGLRPLAEVLYDQLRPYAHRFCVEGIGAACTGAVSWYLAYLARFLERAAEADYYERQARAAHRRVGLVGDPPPLTATSPPSVAGSRPATGAGSQAWPAGPAGSSASSTASLVWEGATWAVTYAGDTRRLRDSKGLRDLAVLLARPGEEVHCLELVGGVDVGSEAGPVLDQQARRAYERRIRELQSDIDEAQAANDPVRAERAEVELDALVQQLTEAFGLSGRPRATGSAAERARSAVGWRIRAAVRHATEVHPVFGRHLRNAVHTGTWCSYRPETAIGWEISDSQGRA